MDTERTSSPTQPQPVDLDLGRGLTVTLQPRMNPLYTAIAHVLPRQGQALLTVTAQNDGDTRRDLAVTVRVDRFSDPESKSMRVDPGAPATLDFFPTFIDAEIAKLDSLHRATLQVEVTEDGRSQTRSLPLDLLAVNSAPLFADDPAGGARIDLTRYLAVYVTPDDARLDALVRAAVDHLPPGVQFNSAGRDVDAQVEALYTALTARGIRYDSATFALDPAAATQTSQRVRLPAQVLASGLANCLEGVFLLASLLEKHKIATAIVLLPPGHAVLGWKSARGADDWRYLDVTKAGAASFAQAQQVIEPYHFLPHDVQAAAPRTQPRRWELAKLRAAGIFPLPDTGHDPLVTALERMADDVAAAVLAAIEQQEQDRLRRAEIEYLDWLIGKFRQWRDLYVALPGEEYPDADAEDDLPPAIFFEAAFDHMRATMRGGMRQLVPVAVDDVAQVIRAHDRLVLLGDPGSGKTTTLWRLVYEYAVAARRDPAAPLPVLVDLRSYKQDESAEAFVLAAFGLHRDALNRAWTGRRVILFLDALNEMPYHDRGARVDSIRELLRTHGAIPVVVTCRTLDFERDYERLLRLEKVIVKPLPVE